MEEKGGEKELAGRAISFPNHNILHGNDSSLDSLFLYFFTAMLYVYLLYVDGLNNSDTYSN